MTDRLVNLLGEPIVLKRNKSFDNRISLASQERMIFTMLNEFFRNEERTIQFLRAFAGTTLAIPAAQDIERVARDRQTANALAKDPSVRTVRRLAGVQGQQVREIAKQFTRHTSKKISDVREKKK